VLSPVIICLLLRYVTGIPPLEEQHRQKYGDHPTYQHYLARTPLLLPR
jgi:steroid 5-alpha reductase family enzyme